MILWNRGRPYKKRLTLNEREAIRHEIATIGLINAVDCLNVFLNLCVFGLTIYLFKFNFIVLAISFVITDALLLIVDHLIFIAIPHWKTTHLSLEQAQKRLGKIKEKRSKIENEISRIRLTNPWNSRDIKSAIDKRRVLDCFIVDEEAWIDEELKKIEEEQVKEDNRYSKDYTDKKEYLISTGKKLEYFKEKQGMDFLTQVSSSVNLLMEILNHKPMGYTLISSVLYIYLDELQKILNQWVGLSEIQKQSYIEDIEKISKALSQYVDNLIDRIKKLETEDIEVSIAVLLKELTKSGGEENV